MLRDLLKLLDSVKKAIVAGEVLDDLLAGQQSLLGQLEASTSRRVMLLQQYDIDPDQDAMRLALLGAEPTLRQQYQDFEELAALCRIHNQALGQLANRRHSFVSRALSALQATPAAHATYSAGAEHAGAADSRWLGSA